MHEATPSPRHDGWTADRRRLFLERIADGATVEAAAAQAGLSAASAYALRRRPAGAAFALGWRAANLLAREHVAATLLARAIDGQVERIVRPDGSVVERHRFDNRLAAAMLARLDRQAEAEGPGEGAAARMVAGDFDAYLDLVAADAGPARAGLFVAAHTDPAAALEPLAALARADALLRRPAGAGAVDTADLDPAARAQWTADQWARAEAAGVIRLAPPPEAHDADDPADAPDETAASPQLPQLRPADMPRDEGQDDPVWFCEELDQWRTDFPPPPGYSGGEDGRYGDPGYSRELDRDERDTIEAPERIARAVRAIEQGRVRDAWFAARAPKAVYGSDEDEDDWPDADVPDRDAPDHAACDTAAPAADGTPAPTRPLDAPKTD